MTKIINLFGGPGSGKSRTSAYLFDSLKDMDINVEMVQEYAKEIAWRIEYNNEDSNEKNKDKSKFNSEDQLNVFAEQYKRQKLLMNKVDIIITDSPLLMSLAYTKETHPLCKELTAIVKASHNVDKSRYLNIFLKRGNKKYNPKGRFQSEPEAKLLDIDIFNILTNNNIDFIEVETKQEALALIKEKIDSGWLL